MNANVKFGIVAVVWLFIIYYVENWLTSQFGALSTTNIFGFIIIALITAFSLFYVVKKAKASPNV
jgi:amino acid transporter